MPKIKKYQFCTILKYTLLLLIKQLNSMWFKINFWVKYLDLKGISKWWIKYKLRTSLFIYIVDYSLGGELEGVRMGYTRGFNHKTRNTYIILRGKTCKEATLETKKIINLIWGNLLWGSFCILSRLHTFLSHVPEVIIAFHICIHHFIGNGSSDISIHAFDLRFYMFLFFPDSQIAPGVRSLVSFRCVFLGTWFPDISKHSISAWSVGLLGVTVLGSDYRHYMYEQASVRR
jgi:hypothetical protein